MPASILKHLFNSVFFLIYNFKKTFYVLLFHFKGFKRHFQHFKFVNGRIRAFVFWCHERGISGDTKCDSKSKVWSHILVTYVWSGATIEAWPLCAVVHGLPPKTEKLGIGQIIPFFFFEEYEIRSPTFINKWFWKLWFKNTSKK